MIRQIAIETSGQGLYELTPAVQQAVSGANLAEGLCTVFVQHERLLEASPPRQPPQRGIAHRHLSR